MQLRISVTVNPEPGDHAWGNLQLQEEFNLGGGLDFLEVAKVLGEFHEMAQKVKQTQQREELNERGRADHR